MKHTSLSKFYSRSDKHLAKRYRLKYLYSPAFEQADTLTEFKIIYHFDMQGHGDIISTAQDILQFDAALFGGKLVKQTTLKEAFVPVKLTNGEVSPGRYGLGWIIREDSLIGKMVYHDGGLPGGRSILLRNITKNQTVFLWDNTANNVIPLANDAVQLLNGLKVPEPKKSLARTYGLMVVNSGVETANKQLITLRKDTLHYYTNENEFNALGYEFMSNQKKEAALAAFELNTQLFPLSWNVYDSYGEILLKFGKKEQAFKEYEKSVALNPNNENGKMVLKSLMAN